MLIFNLPYYCYLLWLFVFSAITFFMFHYDKHRAIIEASRVPEWRLIVMTVLGGSIGAACAMMLFRHKVSKPTFQIVVPVCLVIHLGLAIFLKLYFDEWSAYTIDVDIE